MRIVGSHRRYLLVLLVLAVAAFATACGGGGNGEGEAATPTTGTASPTAAGPTEDPDESGEPTEFDELLTVNVVAIEGNQLFPLRVMELEGIDEAHGVSMELNTVAGPQALYPAMQESSFNVGFGIWATHANLRQGGVPLVNVYSASTMKNDIVVPNDSDIESLEDLRGKRLGIYGAEATGSTIYLRYLMQAVAGFDPMEESEVQFGAAGLLAGQVQGGELDATMLPDPLATNLLSSGEFRSAVDVGEQLAGHLGFEPLFVTMVANEAWAQENPEALTRFIDAYSEALDVLAENEEIWTDLAATVNIENPEAIAMLRERMVAGNLDRWDDELIEDMHDFFADMKSTMGEGADALPDEIPEGTFSTEYVE